MKKDENTPLKKKSGSVLFASSHVLLTVAFNFVEYAELWRRTHYHSEKAEDNLTSAFAVKR